MTNGNSAKQDTSTALRELISDQCVSTAIPEAQRKQIAMSPRQITARDYHSGMRLLYAFVLLLAALAPKSKAQTLAAPLQNANPQFLDCRGVGNAPCPPLAGGKLTSYAAGTTTPLATCATTTLSGANCATPNANPVILNSYGYNAAGSGTTGIWPLPARCYKFKLTDSSNVTLWTIDNVCNQSGLLQASLVASTGAGLIGFSQSATYPVSTIGSKGQTVINIADAPYNALPTASNNATAIAAAAAALNARGGGILQISALPTGSTYSITSAISIPSNVMVQCGPGVGIKNTAAHGGVLTFSGVSNSSVTGCTLIAANGSPAIPTLSTQGNAVTITGSSSYISVTNNQIQGCEFACVYLGINSFPVISRNVFSNQANTTGSIINTATHTILAYEETTDGLLADNWDTTGTNDVGIQISPCVATTANSTRNTIQGNHIANKNRYGIVLYGHCAVSTQQVTQTNVLGNFVDHISSRTFGVGNNNNGMGIYAVDADVVNIGYNFVTNTLLNRTDLILPTGAISIAECYQVKTFFNTINTSLFSGLWFSQAGRAADPSGIGYESVGDFIENTGTNGVTIIGTVGVPVQNTHLTDTHVYNTVGNGIGLVSYAPHTTIINAFVASAGVAGIATEDANSPRLTVTDSRILNPGARGILSQADAPIIRGNRISGTVGNYAGIDVSTAGAGVGGDVSGNEVFGNYQGIRADTSLPNISFINNSVYSNTNADWFLGSLRSYTAKGNSNLPDHSNYSATVTTSAAAISAGACVLEASHQFTGAIGLPGDNPAIPTVVMPTSLPANWIYLTGYVTQAGDTAEFIQCNLTVGMITPDAATIVLSIR